MTVLRTYYLLEGDSLQDATLSHPANDTIHYKAVHDTNDSGIKNQRLIKTDTPLHKSIAIQKLQNTVTDTTIIDSLQLKRDSLVLDSIKQVKSDSLLVVKNDSALAMNRNFLENLASNESVYKSKKVFYTSHSVADQSLTNTKHPDKDFQAINYPGWILGIVLIGSILIAIPKIYYKKYIFIIAQSLINYQQSHKLFKETNLNFSRVSFFLNLNYILSFSLFIFEILRYFNMRIVPGSIVYDYLLIASGILVLYILQSAGFGFFGYMLALQKPFNEYFRQIMLVSKNAGLFLLPMTFIIAYVNNPLKMPLIFFTGLVLTLLYLIRLGRGLKIIISSGLFKLYLFLYFCTLEILPVLVLIRYIKGLI